MQKRGADLVAVENGKVVQAQILKDDATADARRARADDDDLEGFGVAASHIV
jgi:hypothetical protein